MNKSHAKLIATSLTASVFIVIGTTGILLYFKLYEQYVKELHEIIGLLFVAAALAHVFFNWKSMKNYFGKKIFLFSSLAVLIVSLSFIIPSAIGQDGANPKNIIMDSVFNAPLELSIKILDSDKESAMNRLKENGIVVDGSHSILEISKANKTSPFRVVKLIAKQ